MCTKCHYNETIAPETSNFCRLCGNALINKTVYVYADIWMYIFEYLDDTTLKIMLFNVHPIFIKMCREIAPHNSKYWKLSHFLPPQINLSCDTMKTFNKHCIYKMLYDTVTYKHVINNLLDSHDNISIIQRANVMNTLEWKKCILCNKIGYIINDFDNHIERLHVSRFDDKKNMAEKYPILDNFNKLFTFNNDANNIICSKCVYNYSDIELNYGKSHYKCCTCNKPIYEIIKPKTTYYKIINILINLGYYFCNIENMSKRKIPSCLTRFISDLETKERFLLFKHRIRNKNKILRALKNKL